MSAGAPSVCVRGDTARVSMVSARTAQQYPIDYAIVARAARSHPRQRTSFTASPAFSRRGDSLDFNRFEIIVWIQNVMVRMEEEFPNSVTQGDGMNVSVKSIF